MRESSRRRSNLLPNPWGQPLDLIVAISSVVIISLIVFLLWQGDRTVPKVIEFSWQQKEVNASDVAFSLTFNRPMAHKSVEKNLKITPNLPGRTSWAGRKMAYTLNAPAQYGDRYQVSLSDAYDRFASEVGSHRPIQPFSAKFSTPDPSFIYIGADGIEQNRLVKINQTTNSKQILTPKDLAITDFRLYPDRQQILLGAAPYQDGNINILEQQIYRLKIDWQNPKSEQIKNAPMELVLDGKDYQNFKFDLAADGNTIVIQRLSRKQVGQYGLWVIQPGFAPRPLENKPGGDFLITPDGTSVAIAQGEGVAILPLKSEDKTLVQSQKDSTNLAQPSSQPSDFLPKFGMVLDFSQDGTQAAMVKFNKDYTRSLFFVNNQGLQKELLKIAGSIITATFDPQKQILYALLTDADLNAEVFREQPYLAAINLSSGKIRRLLDLKGQRNIQISLAPDGRKMLLSATTVVEGDQQKRVGRDSDSKSNSEPAQLLPKPLPQLFELNFVNQIAPNSESPIQLKSLALTGDRPTWLP